MKWRKEVTTNEEQARWYDAKYLEMKQCWHTPDEELDSHLDRMGFTHSAMGSRRFIDLGCGDGSLCLRALKRAQAWVWGVDLSEVAIKWAMEKREALPQRAQRNCVFIQAEIGECLGAMPEEVYDFVVSLGSLEHVLEVDRVLWQIARVLKPSGVFYNYAPNELWKHEDQPTELVATREEWEEMYERNGLSLVTAYRMGDNTAYIGRKR